MRRHLLQLLPLLGVLVVDVVGEQIQVKLPKPSRDQHGGCLLPDVINIGLLRHQTNSEWELQLRRNDVISKNKMAYVMSRDADGKTIVEHVELGGQETEPLQAYHNHQEGAAVVVRCTTLNTDSPVLVMEGSLYIKGQKFRLSPAARWRQEAEIESNHVATVYNLNSIQEFHPRDATSIAAPNKRAKSTVKRPARRRDQRVKRQTPVYYIDVLPVVDPEMYQQWTDRTERTADVNTTIHNYLATLFTSVSMRLNTLNLSKGRKLELRMLHPFFIIDRGLAPYGIVQPDEKGGILLNATDVLTSFKDWIGMFSSETQLYDHAVLFTGHDMSGGTDSGINFNVTKGVAYTREMCNEKLSISIVGDKGAYQSEGVTAHELGHSLGAEHDGHGESTSCRSEDRFIMADSSYPQTAQNSDNPWVFSPCSSRSIDKYLEAIEGNDEFLSQCLERAIGDPVNKTTTIRADDQCRIFYGQDSFVCREEESPAFSEICHEFFCFYPWTEKCVKMTPATGTCCGPQKKCVMGACVAAAAGECPLDENCPFDDVKSYETVSGAAKCEDAPTGKCYDELFRRQCCNTCKKARNSQTGCPYGDKGIDCQKAKCGSKFDAGEFVNITYDFVCCKTCAGVNQGCADRESNINFEGSSTTCTELLENQGRREVCYQSLAHFDACCDTCEKLRNHSSHSCSWGDHRDCSSLWNTPIGSTCASLNGKMPDVDLPSECCETCPLIEQRQQTPVDSVLSTQKLTTATPIQTTDCGGDSLFGTIRRSVLIFICALCVCLGQILL